MGKIKLTATASFSGTKSKDASLEILLSPEILVNFKPKDGKYKGEFGFDWCEWNIETGEIEKFQDTKVSDIEYILNDTEDEYKSATNSSRQKNLKFIYPEKKMGFEEQYYISWMNLSKGNKATLELTTIYLNKKNNAKGEGYITFKSNADYDITYDKKLNDSIEIPLKKRNKATYDIEIVAKNETEKKSYIEAIDENGLLVGSIEMHPNKKALLGIKIIPVVLKSTEAKEKSEAIALYNKVIKAKAENLGDNLRETLNKHSLNQAGVQSEIEAIKAEPEKIVIDLTKDNWVRFYDNTKKEFKDWDFDSTEADASKRPAIWTSEDGDKFFEYKEGKTINDTKLLLDELERLYYNVYGKGFKGALLFVTEENYYKPNALGYSQNNPLRSQGTIIFKGGLSLSDAYAHELGHMLGLEHVFFKDAKDINEANSGITTQNSNINAYQNNIKNTKDYYNKKIRGKDDSIKRVKEHILKENKTKFEKDLLEEDKQNLEELINEKKDLEEKRNEEVSGYQDKMNDFDAKIKINIIPPFRIKKGTSSNFMDYDISRRYFHRCQAITMQEEVKKFYNE